MTIDGVTTVERAYQLARSGDFRSFIEIRARVRDEGYDDAAAQLDGRAMATGLRRLIETSRRPA
jgi:hypothetical protein